jgi:hypothetical protein
MENGVVNGGKKGKSQGIDGSANANDVWVRMRPHIGFYTIEKCYLLSFFPSALFSLHLLKHRASSYDVSPRLLFNPCSFLFLSFFSFSLSLSL